MTTAETLAYLASAYDHRITLRTLMAWLETGVLVGGVRVKLGGVKLGGRWVIGAADVTAFASALTDPGSPAPVQTPAQRRRESDEATRRLVTEGWA